MISNATRYYQSNYIAQKCGGWLLTLFLKIFEHNVLGKIKYKLNTTVNRLLSTTAPR